MLVLPDSVHAHHRYYVYVTGDLTSEMVFPVYGSDDLIEWHSLGLSLVADIAPRAYWAPCVRYMPELKRPFVMLYSRAIGIETQAHIGHTIRRADSDGPEGPFVDSGHVLTPDIDFAIDPDVYRMPDGSLRLAYATDFVADAPFGTGIVEVTITEDLMRTLTPPTILARPVRDLMLLISSDVAQAMAPPQVGWSHECANCLRDCGIA